MRHTTNSSDPPPTMWFIVVNLNLAMLFVFVTAVCIFLSLGRVDRIASLRWHAARAGLEEEAMKIVRKGKVRFSGNQNKLMVVVERTDFDDADFGRLLDALADKSTIGDVYFLSLSGTAVTDRSVARIAECQGLEYLFLENTETSNAGVDRLQQLPTLKVLCLSGTQVSDSWLDDVRASRPDLRVEPARMQP